MDLYWQWLQSQIFMDVSMDMCIVLTNVCGYVCLCIYIHERELKRGNCFPMTQLSIRALFPSKGSLIITFWYSWCWWQWSIAQIKITSLSILMKFWGFSWWRYWLRHSHSNPPGRLPLGNLMFSKSDVPHWHGLHHGHKQASKKYSLVMDIPEVTVQQTGNWVTCF